jgi:hypothetical protein
MTIEHVTKEWERDIGVLLLEVWGKMRFADGVPAPSAGRLLIFR